MSVDGVGSSNQNTVQNTVSQERNYVDSANQNASVQESSASEAEGSGYGSSAETGDDVAFSDKASSISSRSTRNCVVSADDYESWEDEEVPLAGDSEEKIVISGGKGSDSIDITIGEDGSCTVLVNGKKTVYSSEETKNLYIDGGNGNDTIAIHGAYDSSIGLFIDGGSGDDLIQADEDVIKALNIEGGDGDDTVYAGQGNDVITDQGGSNTVYARGGDDTVAIAQLAGNQTSEDINKIFGGEGNDTLTGGSGQNYIEGGRGSDTIKGGADDDVIMGGEDSDIIDAGAGNDFVNAGHGNDTVNGGDGDDNIFGLAGNDKIYGGAGRDVLVGGNGEDTVEGGAGADTVRLTEGEHGEDKLLDREGEDEVKVLNPIDVPNVFAFRGEQTQEFQDFINDNLEAFASFELGQNLLEGLASSGRQVYFQEEFTNNSFCQAFNRDFANLHITNNADGTRSGTADLGDVGKRGCNALVRSSPTLVNINDLDWGRYNPLVVMAHEMSHAYNVTHGTRDMSFYKDNDGTPTNTPEGTDQMLAWGFGEITGAELQAVGIFADSAAAPNPEGMRENDYREFFHMPVREHYLK